MTRWIDPEPVQVPISVREAVGGHPLIATTLVRRGIRTAQAAVAFLDPGAYTLADPAELPDLSAACEIVRETVAHKRRIAICGDFDADGLTATALLLDALQSMGADVTYRIPERGAGHGLHPSMVDELVAEGCRLLLTCDTGVTAHAAVARARELGIEVVITDHHVPGRQLPPAAAIVNPQRLPLGHPMGTLTGVGVAYQLAASLDPDAAQQSLDLVALGTVADVAALTGDTRCLVQRGLQALQRTDRPGLLALYQSADLRPDGITEDHISFVLAPRLNAVGRLAEASLGVELLTTRDRTRARILAAQAESLNAQRQWLTKQVTDAALGQLERAPELLRDHAAIVLSHPTWPGGVIGIVAGRLAERFGKAVALIATPPGELAQGSARSVPGVDLVAALADCSDHLESFGGHRAAAGFRMRSERIPELRRALSRAILAHTEALPDKVLSIDAYVGLPDLTLDLVAQVDRLAPFGPGNPALTLVVRNLRVLAEATIGHTEEHRRLTVQDAEERTQTLFWWNGANWPLPRDHFDLALTLRANDYRGRAEVQLEWLDARELAMTTVDVRGVRSLELRDMRAVADPVAELSAAGTGGPVQVWAEGDTPAGVDGRGRHELVPGPRLAVWTAPPGPRELAWVLDRVQPEEVLLFGHDPALDDPDLFLRRLAGLAKFALRSTQGRIDLQAAAARTAQRIKTVQVGLQWLAARGQLNVISTEKGAWLVAPGLGGAKPDAAQATATRLEELLAETAAYRAYVRTAPAADLLPHLRGQLGPTPTGEEAPPP